MLRRRFLEIIAGAVIAVVGPTVGPQRAAELPPISRWSIIDQGSESIPSEEFDVLYVWSKGKVGDGPVRLFSCAFHRDKNGPIFPDGHYLKYWEKQVVKYLSDLSGKAANATF